MLVAHKIVDALRGVRGKMELRVSPRSTVADVMILSSKIIDAIKFDFGQVPLIAKDNEKHESPPLLDDELEWWMDGYIPLPFPQVWFEWQVGPGRHCALLEDTGESWRMALLGHDHLGRWAWNGAFAVVQKNSSAFIEKHGDSNSSYSVIGPDQSSARGKKFNLLKFTTIGDIEFIKKHEDFMIPHMAGNFALCVWLTLALNSKSTDQRAEGVSAKLNLKREQSGKSPLFTHTVVDIIPRRYIGNRLSRSTHASPHIHKRRSHLRHFDHEIPNSKLLTEGDRAGQWAIVIPWCWVNKNDATGPLVQEYSVKL